MGETLVVNSKFEHISVLNDVQHVVVDLERVLERSPKLLNFKNHLPISVNFLLAAQVTANELYGD